MKDSLKGRSSIFHLIATVAIFSAFLILSPTYAQSSATAVAQPTVVQAPYAAAIDHARSIAKNWLSRGIPGFAVVVESDGVIVY
jgi:hypothetical protein